MDIKQAISKVKDIQARIHFNSFRDCFKRPNDEQALQTLIDFALQSLKDQESAERELGEIMGTGEDYDEAQFNSEYDACHAKATAIIAQKNKEIVELLKQGKGLDRKELEKMIYSIAHGCFLEPGSKTMRELSQAIINRFGKRELDKEKIKDIICKTSNASYKTLGYIVDEDRLAQTLVNGDVWK